MDCVSLFNWLFLSFLSWLFLYLFNWLWHRLCAADPGCDLGCVLPLGQSCCYLLPVLDAQVAPILFFLHLSVFSFSGSRQKERLWSHGNGRAATQIAKLNATIRFAKVSASPNLYKAAFTFSSDAVQIWIYYFFIIFSFCYFFYIMKIMEKIYEQK